MFIHAEREFKIMKLLQGHPNIVEAVDYIPELLRSRGYIVMEKVHGIHILNHIMEKGPLEEGKAKRIIKKVLSGVAYMHEKGVVHRDMNPTNVFIDEECIDEYIKIMDFNVSKIIDLDKLEKQDDEQMSKWYRYSMFTKTGTPLFTAPEMQQAFKYT